MEHPEHDETAAGPVPEGNRPGHHPARDQDKPDPDAFARRLGLRPGRRRSPSPGETPPFTGPAPVSPVEPAELVAEALGLSVRAAVAVTLLPWRLTVATLRAGRGIVHAR